MNLLKKHLSEEYKIIAGNNAKMLYQKSRTYMPICILIDLTRGNSLLTEWERLKKRFSTLPCIAIMDSLDIELAHYCGTLGIDYVLSTKELHRLEEAINKIGMEKSIRVILSELNIDKTNLLYSSLLKEALLLIENEYIKILNTNEIADTIEISECTLSREFAKYGLPSPKKILLFLKVRHAIKLMANNGLNLQEIAFLSGFTDEKRMGECFKRIFGLPPGEYRKQQINL